MTRAAVAPILLAGLAAALTAAVGATITDLGPWYASLRQPDWAPPDPAYGLAWTLIFALVALAAVFAWQAPRQASAAWSIVGLFALNGFLNLLWSFLFFRAQRPDWAVIEVVFLWFSILAMIVVCARYSRVAAWLLVPYLLWVSFAGVLNWEIVRLNGPFG